MSCNDWFDRFSGQLTRGTLAVLCLSAIAGCASSGAPAPQSSVAVEASFRERLALAPGVRLEASLLDVSRADAAAALLGKTVLEDIGQPPYRLSIPYDPAKIVANHRYAVRVVLMKDSRLLFTSDQIYPVLTGGHPASTQILLKRVSSEP